MRILGKARLGGRLSTYALESNFSQTPMNLLLPGGNNAGSTSAPFAEKKNAKGRGTRKFQPQPLMNSGCDAEGFATRRKSSPPAKALQRTGVS
jgi:hypothetical protein